VAGGESGGRVAERQGVIDEGLLRRHGRVEQVRPIALDRGRLEALLRLGGGTLWLRERLGVLPEVAGVGGPGEPGDDLALVHQEEDGVVAIRQIRALWPEEWVAQRADLGVRRQGEGRRRERGIAEQVVREWIDQDDVPDVHDLLRRGEVRRALDDERLRGLEEVGERR